MMEIPEYRNAYFAALKEAADLAAEIPQGSSEGSLDTETRRELALIDSSVREDTLKPFTNSEFDAAVIAMRDFSAQRITYVTCEVERLTAGSSRTCG